MSLHNHNHIDDDHSHEGHEHGSEASSGPKIFERLVVTALPDSEVEIEGQILAEALTRFRADSLKHFQEEIDVPGFRKGKVPEKIVAEKVGELALLEEAGQLALQKSYPSILRETKVDPIGSPKVSITKLALGNPMSFKITTAVYPEFSLPDYKKIAQTVSEKKETVTVTEKEMEEAINSIRRLQAEKNPENSKEKIKDSPAKISEEKFPAGEDLPQLTEEMVKTFGKFENLADFKIKLNENLTKEKELRNREKSRLSIIKGILEKSDIPLPRILIDSELDRMIAKMKDDVERMGLKMPDYLRQIKKSEEDLRKEWENDAKDRAKMELVLNKVSELEKIEASKEEIDAEVKHLLEHYKDADPLRAVSYFEHIIRNEKVFQFLEDQK